MSRSRSDSCETAGYSEDTPEFPEKGFFIQFLWLQGEQDSVVAIHFTDPPVKIRNAPEIRSVTCSGVY
jgi:hypothetical protein